MVHFHRVLIALGFGLLLFLSLSLYLPCHLSGLALLPTSPPPSCATANRQEEISARVNTFMEVNNGAAAPGLCICVLKFSRQSQSPYIRESCVWVRRCRQIVMASSCAYLCSNENLNSGVSHTHATCECMCVCVCEIHCECACWLIVHFVCLLLNLLQSRQIDCCH